ncbi:unnamed protein product [Arctia plantaginis]|uniref:CLIP domain-containing serine protease n=1 Tax=Arctia plantaginis TaxID=874455 RepID=A0A8S1A3K7_ARCPL|nr:unnamed protein product [Arctia plantaginis]
MNNLRVLSVLFIVGCLIKGLNGQCRTVSAGRGQCISIYNCQELLALAKRMLPQDIDVLRRSECGRVNGVPAVCCPQQRPTPTPPPSRLPPPPPPQPQNKQCTTPDNKSGQCVNLYSCPVLVNMLKQSTSQQNIEFVQRSRCSGPDAYSVCCPSSAANTVKPKNKCEATISALPPDYSSGCCGVDSSVSNKIFGGEEATIDQYPWLVLIEYQKGGQMKTSCGGSLISGRYVLTAAHCLVGPILEKSGKPTRVRLGEYDKNHEGPDCTQVEAGGEDCTEGVVRIPIEKTIAHPEYNTRSGPRWHDIGLIRLNRLAPYTDFIRPICLPKRDITLTINADDKLTTAGWGAVSDRQASSSVKLFVDLPFVSQDICQPAYNNLKKKEPLSKNQLCAGGVKGKDSCRGDSGGPLMFELNRRHEVVGIVSFGHRECGLENIPAIYTHVYQYDSWIRSNITP